MVAVLEQRGRSHRDKTVGVVSSKLNIPSTQSQQSTETVDHNLNRVKLVNSEQNNMGCTSSTQVSFVRFDLRLRQYSISSLVSIVCCFYCSLIAVQDVTVYSISFFFGRRRTSLIPIASS